MKPKILFKPVFTLLYVSLTICLLSVLLLIVTSLLWSEYKYYDLLFVSYVSIFALSLYVYLLSTKEIKSLYSFYLDDSKNIFEVDLVYSNRKSLVNFNSCEIVLENETYILFSTKMSIDNKYCIYKNSNKPELITKKKYWKIVKKLFYNDITTFNSNISDKKLKIQI